MGYIHKVFCIPIARIREFFSMSLTLKRTLIAGLLLSATIVVSNTIPNRIFADYGQPTFATSAAQNPQILRVTYVPSDTNLLIQTSRIQEVTLFNPSFDPQSKKYHFYLNNAVIPASPSNIPVQNDALVDSIHLNQSWSGQVPIVDVTVDMKTASGMNLAFIPQKIMQDGNFMISIRPQGGMPNGTGVVLNSTAGVVTNAYPVTQPVNPVVIQSKVMPQSIAYGQSNMAPIQMLVLHKSQILLCHKVQPLFPWLAMFLLIKIIWILCPIISH